MNEEIKKFKAEFHLCIPFIFILLTIAYMFFSNPSKTEKVLKDYENLKAYKNFTLEQGVK